MAHRFAHMNTAAYLEAVAVRIASAVASSGIRQEDIADGTGIARTTLFRRLKYPTSFTVSELASVCAYMGIDVAEVLEVEDAA